MDYVVMFIGIIGTLCAIAYFVDVNVIAAQLRRIHSVGIIALLDREVMGEGEKIYNTANNELEPVFTYARTALYMVLLLIPSMFLLNILGYQGANLLFSVLILILAIKMAVQWPVVLTVMGLGALENLLQSTAEKPEDVSKGAIEGLNFSVKFVGSIIVLVWILSVILSVIPWGSSPMAFWYLLLGFLGIYLFTTIRGYKRIWWLQDMPIIGTFTYMVFLGIAAILGFTPSEAWARVMDYYINNGRSLKGLSILTLMFSFGAWIYYSGRKR